MADDETEGVALTSSDDEDDDTETSELLDEELEFALLDEKEMLELTSTGPVDELDGSDDNEDVDWFVSSDDDDETDTSELLKAADEELEYALLEENELLELTDPVDELDRSDDDDDID